MASNDLGFEPNEAATVAMALGHAEKVLDEAAAEFAVAVELFLEGFCDPDDEDGGEAYLGLADFCFDQAQAASDRIYEHTRRLAELGRGQS